MASFLQKVHENVRLSDVNGKFFLQKFMKMLQVLFENYKIPWWIGKFLRKTTTYLDENRRFLTKMQKLFTKMKTLSEKLRISDENNKDWLRKLKNLI